MPPGPEDIAREQIDRMLEQAEWAVLDAKAVNLYAKQGVAIREFELKSGYGTADTCCATVWTPGMLVREIVYPPFRIVYRHDKNKVRIVRIWRSERLLRMP